MRQAVCSDQRQCSQRARKISLPRAPGGTRRQDMLPGLQATMAPAQLPQHMPWATAGHGQVGATMTAGHQVPCGRVVSRRNCDVVAKPVQLTIVVSWPLPGAAVSRIWVPERESLHSSPTAVRIFTMPDAMAPHTVAILTVMQDASVGKILADLQVDGILRGRDAWVMGFVVDGALQSFPADELLVHKLKDTDVLVIMPRASSQGRSSSGKPSTSAVPHRNSRSQSSQRAREAGVDPDAEAEVDEEAEAEAETEVQADRPAVLDEGSTPGVTQSRERPITRKRPAARRRSGGNARKDKATNLRAKRTRVSHPNVATA